MSSAGTGRGVIRPATAATCPCESGVAYSRCCRAYHLATANAPTAGALMRSRYTAYVKRLAPYLHRTWHPDTRPNRLELDASPRWRGLTIIRSELGGADDETGVVEFVARYDGGALHETSDFVRLGSDDRRWVYLRAQPK